MSVFFSNKTRCFYHSDDQEVYKSEKTWPGDAVEISEDDWMDFSGAAPEFQIPAVDKKNGTMKWVDNPNINKSSEIFKKNTEIQKMYLRKASLYALPIQASISLGDTSLNSKEKLNEIHEYIVKLMAVDLVSEYPAWPQQIW